MNRINIIVRLSALLLFWFTVSGLYSQTNRDTLQIQAQYIPVSLLIEKYEQKHGLRIFYRPEWFSGIKLNVSELERFPDDFLYRITRAGKCSVVNVDSSTFVLVLPEVNSVSFVREDVNSTLLVGKMEEFGKYKRAVMTGSITDGKTDEPLPGVSLSVEKLNLGTTTDRNGKYVLEMPVGEYEIKLSFIGYEPFSKRIKLVSSGTADFRLFDKTVVLQEVVVSLDRAEFNVSRTQMSLIKLDSRAIRELPGSLGEPDLIKNITLLPGIQSTGEFGTGFFVRGGSSDQNLILIEEVPVFNPSHLFGLTSVVNSDGVASVTLLKAGIPARYGERSSSIMDIRMGSNNPDKYRVRGGIGLLYSKVSIDLPLSQKTDFYLGGRTSYSNWLLHRMPDTDLMNSSAGFYDLNGLFTYTINPRNRISLFGYVSNDRFGLKPAMDYNYGNVLGSARWNHILGKNISSVLTTGFSRYNYSYAESDTIRRENGYRIHSSLVYKNLKYNITWIPRKEHSFDMGINGISYAVQPGKLNPSDSLSLIPPLELQTEKAFEYALYAGDNIVFSPALSAEIGLRYSGYAFLGPGSVFVYDPEKPRSGETIIDTLFYGKNKPIKTFSGFEPRVSFRYSLNDNTSVKLSYNRINQYINLVSNTMVMNPADIWKLSNRTVRPLVCDQIAAGYFRNFMQNRYETSLEIYFKKLNHIIEYKNGASLMLNPALEADLTEAGGYNWGAELYVKKSTGRLTGWLSYSLSSSMRRTSGIYAEEQINNNRYFPSSYDKPHNLNMVGNYHISRRWRFSWTFTYSSGRPVTLPELAYNIGSNQLIYYSDRNKYRLPDYHRLDVSLTHDESLRIKKFWKGSWTISIINLYGRKNIYSVFFKKDALVKSEGNKLYNLYSLYIIGKPLPALTYNFTF